MRRHRTDMELALDSPARLRAVPAPEPPVDASDADLLLLVAQRDRQAFELLYHRYVRSMFGLALRRLRDRQRAEDAVQETFAAVWRSAGSYRRGRGAPPPLLLPAARDLGVRPALLRRREPAPAPRAPSGVLRPPAQTGAR